MSPAVLQSGNCGVFGKALVWGWGQNPQGCGVCKLAILSASIAACRCSAVHSGQGGRECGPSG